MYNIIDILGQLNDLIPQLSSFIDRFNSVLSETGINVITDTEGNMSIDVPKNMPEPSVTDVRKKINIIDSLISNHKEKIDGLLREGLNTKKDSDHLRQLTEKVIEYNKLKNSYKH